MDGVDIAGRIALTLLVGAAAFVDFRERRIPNALVLAGLLGGLALHLPAGLPGVGAALLGALLGVAILFLPFAIGWLGAGDVKLMGAIGALVGPEPVPRILFYAAIAGGALALLSMMGHKVARERLKRAGRDLRLLVLSKGKVMPAGIEERSGESAGTIPYGVAIGAGALLAVFADPAGKWAGF